MMMIQTKPSTAFPKARFRAARAFTLVELLTVLAIILILLAAILVAGPALISRSRSNSTQLLLTVVRDAVEEFQREQTAKPTLTRSRQKRNTGFVIYKKRYGLYPPDELELFTPAGLPGSNAAPNKTLAVGGAVMVPQITSPTGSYPAMKFYTGGSAPAEFEHRDLVAMILAIELYGESSKMILDGISNANRTAGPLDMSGEPIQFLDRPGANPPNGKWDPDTDMQIRYIVDAWGVPLRYFAERDFDPDPNAIAAVASSNHPDWNEVSSDLIRRNAGHPVLVSFGPNGKDQLTQDAQRSVTASLVGEWKVHSGTILTDLNMDNLYADPELKEKLTQP